jgi:hypothetical protein
MLDSAVDRDALPDELGAIFRGLAAAARGTPGWYTRWIGFTLTLSFAALA